MSYYFYTTKMTAKAEKLDDLAAILVAAADLLQANASCRMYLVSKDLGGQSVLVHEVWKDKASHDASLGDASVKKLVQSAIPLLAALPEPIAESSYVGGKGMAQS